MNDEPLHDDDAERAALGCLLTSRTALRDVADIVTPADFYSPMHEQIMAAALAVEAKGRTADPVTVGAAMEADKVRGFNRLYLAELIGGV